MRTLTSIDVLVCVIGMMVMPCDADARRLASDHAPQTRAFTDADVDLPLNIALGTDLQDVVAEMLRTSETFRRQCRLIGDRPRVRVRIQLEVRPGPYRIGRARSDVARYQFGSVTALVRVWSHSEAIELIAHELEHVIEIAEGVDYQALSRLQPRAVWSDESGTFETTRAIQVGRQVKREVRLANATLAATAISLGRPPLRPSP